jgi:hypothetical protein
MGKSKYKRDWHKYDENVITRYTLMFPFYVFEHWWDLLAEENRHAKKTYTKGVQRIPSIPPLVLTLQGHRRSIESTRETENHPDKPRLLNNMGKSKKHGHKIPGGK